MPVLDMMASAVVLLTGLYLVALGALCAARPAAAARFLGRFASTRLWHLVEVVVRILIGVALVRRADDMEFGTAFSAAGWILLASSALLAVVPWRWHARFAHAAVPRATRHLPLLAIASVAGGAFVIWAWNGGRTQ